MAIQINKFGLLENSYTADFGSLTTKKSTSFATGTTSANNTNLPNLLSSTEKAKNVSFKNPEGKITGDSTYKDISKSKTEENVATAEKEVKSANEELQSATTGVKEAQKALDEAKATQSSSSTSTGGKTQSVDTSDLEEALETAKARQKKAQEALNAAEEKLKNANGDKTKSDEALTTAKNDYQNQLKTLQLEGTTTTGTKLDTNNNWLC